MGVDFYACKECGEVYHDCGDEWYICEGQHRVCKWCLGIPDGETIERDDYGYVYSKYCPVCQGIAEEESKKPKVSIADTWLLVRNNDGKVLGCYNALRYARGRRTALKDTWGTTIVKVATVKGCEYPE